MFGRKKQLELQAICDGTISSVDQVPDPVFSQKMLGDGYAIEPSCHDGVFQVVAPCAGEITQIFKTAHAFGITTEQGIELLIHIGLDTVELKGEGLTALVAKGDQVRAGDPVIEVDAPKILEAGKQLITPVVFTKMSQIDSLDVTCGEAKANQVVLKATIK